VRSELLTFAYHVAHPTAIYSLSLHDALPILAQQLRDALLDGALGDDPVHLHRLGLADPVGAVGGLLLDGGVPPAVDVDDVVGPRSEEHTSELQSRENLVCRLLLEKKNKIK